MTLKESLIERFVNAVEKIAFDGLVVCLKADGSESSEKMALDLAAMKVNNGLEAIAEALGDIANELEE